MPHPGIPQAMSAVCHGNQGELNHLEPSWALTPRLCSGDRSCPVQAAGRGRAASLTPHGLVLPSAVVPLTSYGCRVFHCWSPHRLPWVLAVKVLNPP